MTDQPSTTRKSVATHHLESFIVRFRPWLLKMATRRCRNEADADDLVQEAIAKFLKAFANVQPLPPEDECEKWLMTAMSNCFVDQCRRQEAEKQGAQDPVLETLTVAQESEPKLLSETISKEDFASAMGKLSPLLRKTFKLHAEGLRYREIAELEDIPIGTVGKRLKDARKKLLKFLEPLTRAGEH